MSYNKQQLVEISDNVQGACQITKQTDQKPKVPVFLSRSSHCSVAFDGERNLVLNARVSISTIQPTMSGRGFPDALAMEISFDSFEYSLDKISLPNSSSSFFKAFSAELAGPDMLMTACAALWIAALYMVPLK